MNYLLAFLGFLAFVILGMIKTKQKHLDKKFNPIVYLKDEILTLILSAICAVAMVLMLPDIGEILAPEYAGFDKIIAFASGFLNYAAMNQIVNAVIPKKFVEQQT